MGAVRIAIGSVVLGLLGFQGWTQYQAVQYGYHPSLGQPWHTIQLRSQRHSLYHPWQGVVWAWRWQPEVQRILLSVGIGGSIILVALLAGRWQPDTARPPAMQGHGSTAWATRHDVRRAGLLCKTGWVLGAYRWWWWWYRILCYDGEENILLVGPQRQGKGVGPIICSALNIADAHFVVIDMRGATLDATVGYRSRFSRCLVFAPTRQGSHRFNILQEVRKDTPLVFRDAATIAEMLMDPGHTQFNRPDHWKDTARSWGTCGILYEVYTQPNPTLAHMAQVWSDPRMTPWQRLDAIARRPPLPAIGALAQEVLNKEPREASGILSTLITQLFIYRDATLAANTSQSDFHLADFTQQDSWLSLYIVQSPGEEAYVRPYLRMFFHLAWQRWMEGDSRKHRIYQLLDEFPALGTLGFAVDHLAVLGGKGIRTLLAAQNLPQLKAKYGDADLITEQCKIRMYFAAQGHTTGQEIARQTGTGTATTEQVSQRQGVLTGHGAQVQQQHHARALLTAGEASQMALTHAVMHVTGCLPIWLRKVRFWKHRVFRTRSRMSIPAWVKGPRHGR